MHGLYCCMLPQCEALRTCCSGFSNCNSSKCDNVTVDTILPSRSTTKKKLDDKCKLVKANLVKEKQKAIANNGLELSSHTVLVEQNSIFPLFDISYNQCWEFATGSPQNRKSATAEQTFSLRICDTQI